MSISTVKGIIPYCSVAETLESKDRHTSTHTTHNEVPLPQGTYSVKLRASCCLGPPDVPGLHKYRPTGHIFCVATFSKSQPILASFLGIAFLHPSQISLSWGPALGHQPEMLMSLAFPLGDDSEPVKCPLAMET